MEQDSGVIAVRHKAISCWDLSESQAERSMKIIQAEDGVLK
jgi:hypothetical protein